MQRPGKGEAHRNDSVVGAGGAGQRRRQVYEGEGNLADALTHPVSKEIVTVHQRGVGREIRQDRHSIAPVSEYKNTHREKSGKCMMR